MAARLVAAAACVSHGQTRQIDQERLDVVARLYRDLGGDAVERLGAFVAARRELLTALFEAYARDPRAAGLLSPEVLLIFELLEQDRDRLKELWLRHRAHDELEELASVFGVTI